MYNDRRRSGTTLKRHSLVRSTEYLSPHDVFRRPQLGSTTGTASHCDCPSPLGVPRRPARRAADVDSQTTHTDESVLLVDGKPVGTLVVFVFHIATYTTHDGHGVSEFSCTPGILRELGQLFDGQLFFSILQGLLINYCVGSRSIRRPPKLFLRGLEYLELIEVQCLTRTFYQPE
jgi:hypothetical protein